MGGDDDRRDESATPATLTANGTSCEGEPPPETLSGTEVGDFVVVDRLASGGWGAIYRVRHKADGTERALKVLHGHLAARTRSKARFEREAELIARLSHPNLARIDAVDTLPDGRPYFVMELLEGIDLAGHLRSTGPLEPEGALELLEPVCDALEAAHSHGVIHRDVKASNVFLCADETPRRVVLLDFGIAKDLLYEGQLTHSFEVVGTASCVSPEQIARREVDRRADVYALGVLLFELLTGEPPFPATRQSAKYLHLHAPRRRPSSLANVSAAVDEVVLRAMRVEPADRYPTAAAFCAALREAIAPSAAESEQPARALGLYAEARTDDSDAPDDALYDDLARVLELAISAAQDEGFAVALRAASFVLLTRSVPLGGAGAARRGAIELGRRIDSAWRARPEADPRVRGNLCIDIGSMDAISQVSKWAPTIDIAGVCATRRVLEGLEYQTGATASEGVVRVKSDPGDPDQSA